MEPVSPILIALVALLVVALVGAGAWASSRRRLSATRVPELEEREQVDGARRAEPQRTPPRTTTISERFFSGLTRTREALAKGLARAGRGGQADDAWATAVEDALIGADLGVGPAAEITAAVRARLDGGVEPERVRTLLRDELLARIGPSAPLATSSNGPLAILVVGVNGSGKTTTIGKLAARYTAAGQRVLLAAGDTFRAGAIEQLKIWGERSGATVIAHQEGADPAAVIFDGLKAGVARGADVIICDTAGRLQAQKPLMDELGKVVRAMNKALPGAPHEVLLVLDATIGQNALSQARVFKEVVGVTGVVLTKLDGTARGGVVVGVCQEIGVPVKLVGLGEKTEDLQDFDPAAFVDALTGDSSGAQLT